MMSMPTGALVGLVFGIVFGLVFVVTCIISAIKAVRDRKRIKQRIAEKERVKQEAKFIIARRQKMEASIEDRTAKLQDRINQDRNRMHGNGQPASCSYIRTEEPTIYLDNNGVDNLTYAHSRTDMELPDFRTKSNSTAEAFPQKLLVPSNRTLSNDRFESKTHKQFNHLSSECLTVQKILRRHSYEVAVFENSWMPTEPPRFASSRSIIQTYNFGERPYKFDDRSYTVCSDRSYKFGDRAGTRTATVGFVNRAYDKDDRKKT